MNTDHGGWTVFQHRVNGSVDFYQNFSSFENGFGSLQGEFWLGLKLVYEMTSRTTNDLRIDIARANDSTAFVVYTDFSVGAGTNYTLHVGNSRSESGRKYDTGRYVAVSLDEKKRMRRVVMVQMALTGVDALVSF
ncbi:ficolin-2-like [Mya arenaria]|uniref:ficolin-2-like n=1 Tax=Mya arenaria TaxID=6604 RepID=UPI0022E2C857|nr:ficolin-2-like [Mya arenaria]